MKRLLFLFLFGFLFLNVHAQTKYTIHTIAKGETLTMLAQKYHTSVGDIMRLNGMKANSQLKLGEKIKIPSGTVAAKAPATKTTVTKTVVKPSTDTSVITHYVLQGETLFSISKKFNVTIDELKQWNNLNDDNIHFGQLLAVSSTGTKVVAGKYAQQQKSEQPKSEAINNIPDTQQKEIAVADTAKQEALKQTVVVVENKAAEKSKGENVDNTQILNRLSESFFEKDFSEKKLQLKKISGDAMTFKTASGWADKKYYILTNEIPQGKIVKITSNGKSIYAKVLWNLNEIKTSNGVNFLISDAAASTLGVNESKFNLSVAYNE